MSRLYMEDALDNLKNYYDDNLNGKLTTIESERGENIPRLGNLTIGESTVQKFPRMEILPDDTDHDYGFTDRPLTRPWLVHSILIWIEHTSGSKGVVRNTLMRYVEAINKLAEDNNNTFAGFVNVELGVEDYTPMIEDQKEKKMIQGVSIQMTCKSL